MTFLFDFDDTLFDTQSFASGTQTIFAEYGIDGIFFWESYRKLRGSFSPKGWAYSFEKHVDMLKRDGAIHDDRALRKRLATYLADTSAFLFPEVSSVLAKFHRIGCKMTVLSFGDAQFQTAKVRNSGLEEFIDGVIVTETDKGEALHGVIAPDESNVYFFDDKLVHIEDVKRSFPNVHAILTRRNSQQYPEALPPFCDFVVHDLRNIAVSKLYDAIRCKKDDEIIKIT
jgi:FMN phosphatase YigB (HAD superfamily)